MDPDPPYQYARHLISQLCDPAPGRRALAADATTDHISAHSSDEADLVCRVLAAFYIAERDADAAESLLNAITEFDAWNLAPEDAIALIVRENRWQTTWALEYLEGIQGVEGPEGA